MSNRPNPSNAPGRVLAIAFAAAIVAVIIGVVIALSGGSDDVATTDTRPVFGEVTVEGSSLEAFASTDGDSAIGERAPVVSGSDSSGSAASIGEAGEPTIVAFLAHWCPHCQAELPVLVDLMADGELEGIRMVAVLTGTSAERPNYPPLAWLDREGWEGDTLLDDESSTAAQAYGLTSYPFLVFLDADGTVVARTVGEIGGDAIVALADQAR